MGKLVNISEAAQIMGVTTTTLQNLDKKGLLTRRTYKRHNKTL